MTEADWEAEFEKYKVGLPKNTQLLACACHMT
jgi:hypothetical protein